MTGPDPLRDELRELADTVTPTDLYERTLTRSRRIGRREAVVGTTAAVVALALLGSGLWQLPRTGPAPVRPAAAPALASSAAAPVAPTATGAPAQGSQSTKGSGPARPRPARTTADPRSTALADLPGRVFYTDPGDAGRLVRLTPGEQPETVLAEPYATVGVSPDGERVAYVTDGALMVVDTGGGDPRQAYPGTASAAQAPAWSPDGGRLLIGAAEPGVLDVATGTLTPLPSGLDGRQFRWSGDGSRLVYATAGCGLEVAEADAQTGTPVPGSGDPAGRTACRPVSVDATGDLVTVRLEESAPEEFARGDAAAPADAVLDTVTGDIVELPVSGKIIGAVFNPDGYLLVRSVRHGTHRLWLFAPDFTLVLRAREPAALSGLGLLAYTR
ncbi:TolB family protein [Actinoplanes sp. NPDC049599]|uniref:TolB family protein n=1 Tax=Actinoplanes sp. NPDC049599 TaxID=3363903 RepID=UPI0037922AEF